MAEPRVFRFRGYEKLWSLYNHPRRVKPTEAQCLEIENALQKEAERKSQKYVVLFLISDGYIGY